MASRISPLCIPGFPGDARIGVDIRDFPGLLKNRSVARTTTGQQQRAGGPEAEFGGLGNDFKVWSVRALAAVTF
jgi:hypothetical protein